MLHLLPPAVVAWTHGRILYGRKGILVFTIACIAVAGSFESLSLRTGFPFGHYFFTGIMGPKISGLPVLLVLAYLGIGYSSWILALVILGLRDKPLSGTRVVAAPALAAFIMLAWDIAMDPQWAAIDRAWVWLDGGPFFGVPVSNFFGWYLTSFCFYQIFALYIQTQSVPQSALSKQSWRAPILVYLICAAGNLFVRAVPLNRSRLHRRLRTTLEHRRYSQRLQAALNPRHGTNGAAGMASPGRTRAGQGVSPARSPSGRYWATTSPRSIRLIFSCVSIDRHPDPITWNA